MTSLHENLSVAFAAIMANKMRSVLTMLGIIIGISAVITIVSIGSGQGKKMQDQMNNQGFANISISVSRKEGTEDTGNSNESIKIDQDLLREVYNKHASDCDGISIALDMERLTDDWTSDYTKTKRNRTTTYFRFTSDGFWKASKFTFLAGKPFTLTDIRNGARSIILTDAQAKNLFGEISEDCIGQTVECYFLNMYSTFTVRGVIKQPADFTLSNYYVDPLSGKYVNASVSYMPYKAYEVMTGKKPELNDVIIIPKKGSSGDTILELIEALKSDLNAEAPDYMQYNASSSVDYIKQIAANSRNQFLITALVAAIALLVGGIGVMNIMMVSITERTREIGTRKALGATNASLLFQFITEAVLLCLIGGLIGIVLGIIFGIIACRVMDLPYVLEPLSILISVLFSLLIGGFFGYYPANKAAKMNPIDALRYE